MVFRIEGEKLLYIDVPDNISEDEFVLQKSSDTVKFLVIDEDELPLNPYPTHPLYKYTYDEETAELKIELDLEEMIKDYKEEVVSMINTVRDNFLQQGFTWNDPNTNTQYQIGLTLSEQKALQTIALEALLGQTENLFFISKDNQVINLTNETAKQLALDAANYAGQLIYITRIYKDKILAAETFQEIAQYIDELKQQIGI